MKLFVSGVFFLALILSLQLNAQPRHQKRAPAHEDGPGNKKLMEQLNLTDQQEEQVSKLRSEHQLNMIDSRAEIRKLEVQLNDEKRKKDLDEEKILSLTKQIGEQKADLQTRSTQMWLNVYNLLDEKQKEIWKDHRPERKMRHERLRHKRLMDRQ